MYRTNKLNIWMNKAICFAAIAMIFTNFLTFISASNGNESPKASGATVTAHVFSGRPNPKWPISAKKLEAFQDMDPELKQPILSTPRIISRLNYSGLSVNYGEGKEIVYVFAGKINPDRTNYRAGDKNKALEPFLLETAPKEIISDEFKEFLLDEIYELNEDKSITTPTETQSGITSNPEKLSDSKTNRLQVRIEQKDKSRVSPTSSDVVVQTTEVRHASEETEDPLAKRQRVEEVK